MTKLSNVNTIRCVQEQVRHWTFKNFGHKHGHHLALLGAMEELGELCHAHLKSEQGIRTNEDHDAMKEDAIGDIVIYLADYCESESIDLQNAIVHTWEKVRARDWKRNSEKGEGNDNQPGSPRS